MKMPETIPQDKNGQYCFECYSPNVQRIFKGNLTYYQCSDCKKIHERSLVIDDAVTWWVDEEKNYWHESVGVLVIAEDKLLTQFRQIFPFAYTIPAGHLDKGELPEVAAKRELQEETGITVQTLKTMMDGFDIPGDSCRRGCDHHKWHLYRAQLESCPEVHLSDEANLVKWMTFEELKNEPQLVYPLKFFVNTIGEGLFN